MKTEQQTIDAIITHLRATRPELVHFAGAMHRDPNARRVIEEYLLAPSASEKTLREHARTREAPSHTLADLWAWFRDPSAGHLRGRAVTAETTAKVTGETITDEQIRSLQSVTADDAIRRRCLLALGIGSPIWVVRQDAREECASVWNALHKEVDRG